MISLLSLWQYVSMSVSKRFFSKTTHMAFLKLLMELACPKGKKVTKLDCWGKNGKKLMLGKMPKNIPKNVFLCFAKNSSLMCRFFEFKLYTIMTFMILSKLDVWGKPVFQFKCKNTLGQSDCRIFKL